jgi:cytochrome c556
VVISATAVTLEGTAALAQSGAIGIVKERMDGMAALGNVVKVLTPMMRGHTPFDAGQARDGADAIFIHAGEQMTSLFPEGSDGMPSQALPAIWNAVPE